MEDEKTSLEAFCILSWNRLGGEEGWTGRPIYSVQYDASGQFSKHPRSRYEGSFHIGGKRREELLRSTTNDEVVGEDRPTKQKEMNLGGKRPESKRTKRLTHDRKRIHTKKNIKGARRKPRVLRSQV